MFRVVFRFVTVKYDIMHIGFAKIRRKWSAVALSLSTLRVAIL